MPCASCWREAITTRFHYRFFDIHRQSSRVINCLFRVRRCFWLAHHRAASVIRFISPSICWRPVSRSMDRREAAVFGPCPMMGISRFRRVRDRHIVTSSRSLKNDISRCRNRTTRYEHKITEDKERAWYSCREHAADGGYIYQPFVE